MNFHATGSPGLLSEELSLPRPMRRYHGMLQAEFSTTNTTSREQFWSNFHEASLLAERVFHAWTILIRKAPPTVLACSPQADLLQLWVAERSGRMGNCMLMTATMHFSTAIRQNAISVVSGRTECYQNATVHACSVHDPMSLAESSLYIT